MSIVFKLSQDPRLLQQYYQLREQCFREELGLPDFDGSEDDQDRQAHILIAIEDGHCIGGARISSRLPLLVRGRLCELDLAPGANCMWERAVLDPTVRTAQLFQDFCAHLIETSRMLGYQHALVLSTLRISRFYRQCHSAMGVGFQIHRHVPECAQAEFASLEHYLSVAHLQDLQPLRIAA